MAEPHVITAQVKKRGELAGELAEIDKRRREIAGRIDHVDYVLTMFGYGDDPKAIPARRKHSRRIEAPGYYLCPVGRTAGEDRRHRDRAEPQQQNQPGRVLRCVPVSGDVGD